MKCLNVGCGSDIRDGEIYAIEWINLDNHGDNGADVIFDLENIYKGKKLPFKDNTFDVILCNHVLHTFHYPLPILQEVIRVCKVGGLIDIKTHMPNANNSSINMVRGHTQGMLRAIADGDYFTDYNKDSKKALRQKGLKIKRIKYYTNSTNPFVKCAVRFCNLLHYKLVEKTFLMSLFPFLSINVRYEKQ
jgi:SAM-dependent methyltransferase